MQRTSLSRQEGSEPFHQFFNLLMTHWKNIGLHENTDRNKPGVQQSSKA